MGCLPGEAVGVGILEEEEEEDDDVITHYLSLSLVPFRACFRILPCRPGRARTRCPGRGSGRTTEPSTSRSLTLFCSFFVRARYKSVTGMDLEYGTSSR